MQIWPHLADWTNDFGSWKLFSCHSFLASSTYIHLCLCKNNHYSLNCTLKKVISKMICKNKNKASIAFFVHSLRASSCTQGWCSQYPWLCDRPLLTHISSRDSWTFTGKSGSLSYGVTASFSCVLVCIRFCLCPPSMFPQSCGSSMIQSHCPSKSNSLGVLSLFARSPGWGICCGL